MPQIKPLDIIIPVALELDWMSTESILRDIREQKSRYGFTKFILAAPCGGWRSAGFPPKEHWQSLARRFAEIRETLAPEGIECGWWITATLKSGGRADFTPITKPDGTESPFASCPFGENFAREFSDCVASFAAIAKPAFIMIEDDYAIVAASPAGCFCDRHVRRFSELEGASYTRETLSAKLENDLDLRRRWQKFNGDTLVKLAERVRSALDLETPEIPMGTMQPGGDDREDCCDVRVARALAGQRHTPFSRICGAFYGCMETKKIPQMLFHALYTKQHIEQPFTYYHESDTYPHTRFYISGAQMRATFGTVYSYGFDGSTFQTQQLLDDPNEEKVHGDMFCAERKRFEVLHQAAKQCVLGGAELHYDPFTASNDKSISGKCPAWQNTLFHFGIPYTTTPSGTAFWDARRAACATDAEIRSALAKCLFLDGDAAKVLCDRGYAADLGVEVGEPISQGRAQFDLAEREVVRDAYCTGKGHNMPSAHMFSPKGCGNGVARSLTVLDDACEVLTDEYTFRREYIAPTMTRYTNRYGGKITVTALTVSANASHALLNYRRQRLLQEQLIWGGDEVAFPRETAELFTIQNEAVNPADAGFTGLLTLIPFGEDTLPETTIHLPKKWAQVQTVLRLNQNGEWQRASCTLRDRELTLSEPLGYLDPCYLMLK